MDLYEAMLSRRTVYAFDDRPVPDEALWRGLEAARWAPNHKLTEPWRFAVVGAETRARLGDVAERLARGKCEGLAPDEIARQLSRARGKVTKLPALVVVSQQRTPGDTFREKEDFASVSIALHQLVLALWQEGIGAQWGTGGIIRDDETYRILQIDPAAEEICGFVKIGYPEKIPSTRRRPLAEVVRVLP